MESIAGVQRFEKDILPVGRYIAAGKRTDITPAFLVKLKANFDLATGRGNCIPLSWGHPDDPTDPRTTCGYVESLTIRGDRLWAVVVVPDARTATKLSTTAGEVSVGIDAWVDGKGNEYYPMLTHLGLVNRPVVTDQGPFRKFSASTSSGRSASRGSCCSKGACAMGKQFRFAAGEVADGSGVRGQLIQLANILLEDRGMTASLSPTASDEELAPQLTLILQLVGAEIEEQEDLESQIPGSIPQELGALPMSTLMSTLARKPYTSSTHSTLKRLFSTGKGRQVPRTLRDQYTKREIAIQTEQAKVRRLWGLTGSKR
jgi:hypothetical protein